MDFFAVFRFSSENVELTAAQRLLELWVVCGTAVLLAVPFGILLVQKIRAYRAQKKAETEKDNACKKS